MNLRALLLLAALGLACRRAPAPSPPAHDQRGELLQRILTLDEVAPCLTEAGVKGVHLVEAELAGEAAVATFACENGTVRGRVTFFRMAGTWSISTKAISTSRDH